MAGMSDHRPLTVTAQSRDTRMDVVTFGPTPAFAVWATLTSRSETIKAVDVTQPDFFTFTTSGAFGAYPGADLDLTIGTELDK